MRSESKLVAIAVFVFAAAFAAAAEEHVGRNLERGEPQRWNEPVDSPQKRYANAMKEAKAAQAEALKDCRSAATQRKACEKQARSQYRLDVEAARELLAR